MNYTEENINEITRNKRNLKIGRKNLSREETKNSMKEQTKTLASSWIKMFVVNFSIGANTINYETINLGIIRI